MNMNEQVLFSPIGHTDPVARHCDGSFLHILRHRRPQRAYLFMSAEVATLDDKDDRYAYFARRLCEKEGFACEIIKLKHREVTKPNDFEAFYEPFEKTIDEIVRDNPNCDILVNLSSGTPQMKNACNLICALSCHRLIPLQVDSPGEGGARVDALDVQSEWEQLEGNTPQNPATNRLREVASENLKARFAKEYITTLINNFDYVGALSVAQSIDRHISHDALRLLEAARLRFMQNNAFIEQLTPAERAMTAPPAAPEERTVFEYILYLQIKQARGELMDFARGISPVIADLYEAYLKNNCRVDVKEKYCEYDSKRKTYMVRAGKIQADSADLWAHFCGAKNRDFEDSFLAGSNLCLFISFFSDDDELKKKINMLQEYEQLIRNKAAHEIICVDDAWIEKKGPQRKPADIKRTPQASLFIVKLLQDVYLKAFRLNSVDWAVYDTMNREIEKQLNSPTR